MNEMTHYRVFADGVEQWQIEAESIEVALAAAVTSYSEALYFCVIGPDNEREIYERPASPAKPLPQAKLLDLGNGKVAYFDSYGNTRVSG